LKSSQLRYLTIVFMFALAIGAYGVLNESNISLNQTKSNFSIEISGTPADLSSVNISVNQTANLTNISFYETNLTLNETNYTVSDDLNEPVNDTEQINVTSNNTLPINETSNNTTDIINETPSIDTNITLPEINLTPENNTNITKNETLPINDTISNTTGINDIDWMNHSLPYTKYDVIKTEDGFGKVVKGIDITVDQDAKFYMDWYEEEFTTKKFEQVKGLEIIKLRHGLRYRDRVGVVVGEHKYIIQIWECFQDKTCELLVNGVNTGKLPVTKNKPSLNLINFHSLEILSIEFYKCDIEICRPVEDTYTEVRVAVR